MIPLHIVLNIAMAIAVITVVAMVVTQGRDFFR
jgi:hypothetical protein